MEWDLKQPQNHKIFVNFEFRGKIFSPSNSCYFSASEKVSHDGGHIGIKGIMSRLLEAAID